MTSPARPPAAPPAFELLGASVRYGRTTALADVDLAVPVGLSLALVGANGSGKTTLLHVLARLVPLSAGRLVIADDAHPAYVLQHTAARAWMPLTVDEVLGMGRYRALGLFRRPSRADRRLVAESADRLAVGDLRDRQFGALSGGQQQRVLVAQALAQGAPLLLMDEPITGLDLVSQERILDVIDEETDRGTTVVLSTHHLDEAHHCDLVAVLATRLIAIGAPDDVLRSEILRAAYADDRYDAHAQHDHPSGLLLLDDDHHHEPR